MINSFKICLYSAPNYTKIQIPLKNIFVDSKIKFNDLDKINVEIFKTDKQIFKNNIFTNIDLIIPETYKIPNVYFLNDIFDDQNVIINLLKNIFQKNLNTKNCIFSILLNLKIKKFKDCLRLLNTFDINQSQCSCCKNYEKKEIEDFLTILQFIMLNKEIILNVSNKYFEENFFLKILKKIKSNSCKVFFLLHFCKNLKFFTFYNSIKYVNIEILPYSQRIYFTLAISKYFESKKLNRLKNLYLLKTFNIIQDSYNYSLKKYLQTKFIIEKSWEKAFYDLFLFLAKNEEKIYNVKPNELQYKTKKQIVKKLEFKSIIKKDHYIDDVFIPTKYDENGILFFKDKFFVKVTIDNEKDQGIKLLNLYNKNDPSQKICIFKKLERSCSIYFFLENDVDINILNYVYDEKLFFFEFELHKLRKLE
ncbi:hypothetical protein GVAV_000921 [Gurleya vavrai]